MEKKNIALFVSTAGHVTRAEMLADYLDHNEFNAIIVCFPSNPIHNPKASTKYYFWNGARFSDNFDDVVESYADKLHSSHEIFVAYIDSLLRFLARKTCNFLSNIIILLIFFTLLIMKGGIRYLFKSIFIRNSTIEIGRELLNKSILMLEKLYDLWPSYNTLYVGSPLKDLKHRIFYNLFLKIDEYSELKRFLIANSLDVIILPEQNFGYHYEVVFAVAEELGVKIFVYPYSLAGRQEWAENFIHTNEARVNNFMKQIFSYYYPEWTYNFKDTKLILPINYLISCLYFNQLPTIPWVTNSGPSGKFIVDNKFTSSFL